MNLEKSEDLEIKCKVSVFELDVTQVNVSIEKHNNQERTS